MKRMSYFVIALALMLGLAQCKKESIEPQNEGGVRITLNVENSGNRHAVDTELGTVTYQDGDVIYVGDGSHFIGTLTRESGIFSGTINPTPDDGAQIHFYFLGGLTPSVTPEAGSTSNFTVNISDQTSKLPVLSYECVTYHDGTTNYSCELKNKCGLVRFPLANEAGAVKVSGMHTEATISFNGTPGITPTDATGQVSLYSVSETEKWAILLPQGRVTDAYLQGVQVDVPQVMVNARIVSIPTIVNPATMINLDNLSSSQTVAQDGAIIYGDLSSYYHQLFIAHGATVTLRDATINKDGWYDANFAGITCNGDATIILEGDNVVRGFGDWYPGIQINGGSTLTIMGNGSLTVSPRNTNIPAAGIGAIGGNDCGNIVITGGNISATGGKGAAAIGACEDKSCGYITITDGVTRVEATKGGNDDWGSSPLSIGKGADSDSGCGTVTIGGTVYWNGYEYQNDGYAYLSQSPLVYPSSTPTPPTPSAETITWDGQIISQIEIDVNNANISYEHGGITVSGVDGGQFYGLAGILCQNGPLYFSFEEGNITKIEIFYDYESSTPHLPGGSAWSINGDEGPVIWEGDPTTTVTLETGAQVFGITQIVFTVEAAAPTPTPTEATVTWINYHIQQIFLGNGEGEYYQGVGVQLDDDLEESYWDGTDVYLYEMGMLTFQIYTDGAYAEYDIKKIEIYYSSFSGNLPEGGGWSNDGSKLTWDDGLTPSVILQNQGPDPDMSIEVTEVVFTLQKSTK